MLEDLHAQRVQEQVLTAHCLVKIEACIAVFSDDGLFSDVTLLHLLHLIDVLWVNIGLVLIFRIDTALFKEMPSE